MPVTVIVGGQFGSEGKGKVAYEFARRQRASIAVRVGGSNSGHTVIAPSGQRLIFRHLPTAAILPDTLCVLPAGSYIDVDVLLHEVAIARLAPGRLIVDRNAVVITEREKAAERAGGLGGRIGSTLSGTGAAVIRRIQRDGTAVLAGSDPRLAPFLLPPGRSARSVMRDALTRKERIVIEGTQGFGLSLLHSDDYPYVTSRDTTAAAFVAEAGLSPLDVDDVVLVIRAFPIRVAGGSGLLPKEINWSVITQEGKHRKSIIEKTSVTHRVRRVARLDNAIIKAAIEANNPSNVVLNHLDYLKHRVSPKLVLSFICRVQEQIGYRVDFYGLGPSALLEMTGRTDTCIRPRTSRRGRADDACSASGL